MYYDRDSLVYLDQYNLTIRKPSISITTHKILYINALYCYIIIKNMSKNIKNFKIIMLERFDDITSFAHDVL